MMNIEAMADNPYLHIEQVGTFWQGATSAEPTAGPSESNRCSGFQQGIKASLAEVVVGCKAILEFKFLHEDEADAVSKGPFFIIMTNKEAGGRTEPIRVDPLQPQDLACGSRSNEIGSSGVAVTHQ